MATNIQPIDIQLMRQCIGCDYTSYSVIKMRNHINCNCRTIIPGKWICPVSDCMSESIKKQALDAHMLKKHYDICLKYVTSLIYQCDSCNHRDVYVSHMLDHIKCKIPQSNFECYHCHQIFNCKQDLTNHFITHQTIAYFKYKCSECTWFATTSKRLYDLHVLQSQCRKKNLKYVTMCSSIYC